MKWKTFGASMMILGMRGEDFEMLKEFTSLRMMNSFDDEAGMDMQQKQVQSVFRDIYDVPIIKGELMDLVFPAAPNTDLKFQHTLKRVPKGYITVALSADGIIYTAPTALLDPAREIILRASIGALVARIWIF